MPEAGGSAINLRVPRFGGFELLIPQRGCVGYLYYSFEGLAGVNLESWAKTDIMAPM